MDHVSPEFLALQAALAGEYSLERELGRGGMGVVYLAREVQLDRDVAIKVLPGHLAARAADRERFLREARTAAGLSHPHIVPIHRVGEAGGFVFFVMSYIAGETLGERLRTKGPLPPADAMRILREVAWALAHAHGRGIVHRDVKPDNILLEAGTGRALVTDFGIAQGGGAGPATDPGKIMGTAHFMSPEQGANGPIDGRSDIYALGVVGYLAVSGRLPFESRNLPALLVRQATESAPSVAAAAPGLPPALAHAIDRCLQRDAGGRFPDGESLASALAPPVDAKPVVPATLRAWLGTRNPLLTFYTAGSALAGLLTTINLVALATGHRPGGSGDIWFLAALAISPVFPIVGFHLNQAHRQFRAGHSLADLRAALEVSRREREEGDALVNEQREGAMKRFLRLGTFGSLGWLGTTFWMLNAGVLSPQHSGIFVVLAPILSAGIFTAVANALEVRLVPAVVRERMQVGIRERLWNSRVGEWCGRRLGAPTRSTAVGAGVFRATEAALGVAAADLWAALPKAQREQLADLPQTVTALEARAAAARAAVEALDRLPVGGAPGDEVADRRDQARTQLASTVAALEGIRLDLLRLHAGASDLSPLTTLLDAARLLGDDVNRLADAQREADAVLIRLPAARRIATPA